VGKQIWLFAVDCFQPSDCFSFTYSPFLSHLPFYQFSVQPEPQSYCSPFMELAVIVDPAFYHHVDSRRKALDIASVFSYRKLSEFIPD